MAAAQVVAQRGVVAVGHTVQACGGIGLKDPRDLESNLFSVAERLECQIRGIFHREQVSYTKRSTL